LKDSLHLAINLVGVPYVDGGNTPKGFDCWGLVWFMFNETGADFPKQYDFALRSNHKDLISLTEQEANSASWQEIDHPDSDCVVAFSKGRHITHVGYWLHSENLVLHATSHGVVCESLLDIKRKRNLTPRFYKWQK
jgi:cell wall-associated NlpC family hydrolase